LSERISEGRKDADTRKNPALMAANEKLNALNNQIHKKQQEVRTSSAVIDSPLGLALISICLKKNISIYQHKDENQEKTEFLFLKMQSMHVLGIFIYYTICFFHTTPLLNIICQSAGINNSPTDILLYRT